MRHYDIASVAEWAADNCQQASEGSSHLPRDFSTRGSIERAASSQCETSVSSRSVGFSSRTSKPEAEVGKEDIKMILELLLALLGGLLVSLALAMLGNAVRCKILLHKYKKLLPNTPFLDQDVGWFSNHLTATLMGKNSQLLRARHEELGDTIGFLINDYQCISTTDLELIKRVMLDNSQENVNRLDLCMPIEEFERDCILFAKDDQWRRLRRCIAPALKPARFKRPNVARELESSVNRLLGAIDASLAVAQRSSGAQWVEFAMENLVHRFSLNVVMSCFYKQYSIVNFNLSERCQWIDMIEGAYGQLAGSAIVRLGFIVPAVRRAIDWLCYNLLPVGRWRRDLMSFLAQQAASGLEARKRLEEMRAREGPHLDEDNFTLKDGTNFQRNIVDYIVDQFHSGKLSKSEYLNSSAFLFNAADKTAADVLVYAIYQLARNQELQERLRQCIRQAGPESQYLDWCLHEALRMNPPVPGGCSRTTAKAITLSTGDTIPAGTFILTPLFAIHRLANYWGPDADQFRPERFAAAHSFHAAQFLPFGAGVRKCPGREFAMYEMRMLLAALLDRYNFRCQVKEDLMDFSSPVTFMTHHKTPFLISVSRLLAA